MVRTASRSAPSLILLLVGSTTHWFDPSRVNDVMLCQKMNRRGVPFLSAGSSRRVHGRPSDGFLTITHSAKLSAKNTSVASAWVATPAVKPPQTVPLGAGTAAFGHPGLSTTKIRLLMGRKHSSAAFRSSFVPIG